MFEKDPGTNSREKCVFIGDKFDTTLVILMLM